MRTAVRLGRTMTIVLLVLALAVMAPAPARAQTPPPSPPGTNPPPVTPPTTPPSTAPNTDGPDDHAPDDDAGGPLDFLPDVDLVPEVDLVPDLLPDPKDWAAEVFTEVLLALLKSIADALRAAVGGVLASSLNFITRTPPEGTYASPTVHALWQTVRLIANAGLVLVAFWGGVNLMLREQIGVPYHEAMELVPRLVVGALLVNTSLAWGQLAIDLNNALCQAVGPSELPAWERADSTSALLADLIAAVVYLVTGLLLVLQMLMRLALLDVLLAVSPLALLCWVLPQTQGWARLWSHSFVAAVFTQFLQVLALRLGGALLTDLTPLAADSALLSVLLGVAVLALTLKIPALLRAQTGDGLGFIRYVAYRQGAQALAARTNFSRGSSGAARAGGGA